MVSFEAGNECAVQTLQVLKSHQSFKVICSNFKNGTVVDKHFWTPHAVFGVQYCKDSLSGLQVQFILLRSSTFIHTLHVHRSIQLHTGGCSRMIPLVAHPQYQIKDKNRENRVFSFCLTNNQEQNRRFVSL